jgi:hypothetical protein
MLFTKHYAIKLTEHYTLAKYIIAHVHYPLAEAPGHIIYNSGVRAASHLSVKLFVALFYVLPKLL